MRRADLKLSPVWKRRLEREVPAILLSLIAAVVLWYFNQLRFTQERSFQVEPQLRISDQMIPLKGPRAVTIRVKGDQEQLINVEPEDFSVIVDLTGSTTEGEHEGRIRVVKSGMARHLKGIEVSHTPSLLRITLERKITRPVKVKVNTAGAVRAGYEVEIGVPAPDEVMVTGARSEMAGLEFLETETIDMEELTGTVEAGARSVTLDRRVRLLPVQGGSSSLKFDRNQEILYSVRIRELVKQVTVRDLYINQIGPDASFSYRLNDEYADLLLSGPELVLNRLDVSGLVLGVELDGITAPGEYTLPVIRMFTPEVSETMKQITDLGLEPSEVKVKVELK